MADLKAQHGYTLVEVLVAFAVLAVAAGALMSVFGAAPGKTGDATHRYAALVTARSVLARVANDQPLVAGEYQGQEEGVRWVLTIEPYGKERGDAATALTRPYLVRVRTRAGRELGPAEVTLTTVRLGLTAP